MKRVLIFMMGCLMMNINAFAVFQTADGYAGRELYAADDINCRGLFAEDGTVYFGHQDAINALDTSGGDTVSTVSTIGRFQDVGFIFRQSGTTYISYQTAASSGQSVSSSMGYINGSGGYVEQLTLDGVYDAALDGAGNCYIVANPGSAGSQIYQYDYINGSAALIADVGGYSGGIAVDAQGNLYYAYLSNDFMTAQVLRFTADELSGDVLSYDQADVALSVGAGYLGFDAEGNFYATVYGTLAHYDLTAGTKIKDIAFGYNGKFVWDDDSVYLIDTDWGTYTSTIQQVYAVPEPVTGLLLAVGALCLGRRMKKPQRV